MKLLKPFLVIVIVLLSLVLILYPDSSILLVGMAIAFLAVFIYASFSQDEGARARWIFVAIFIFLAGVIGWLFHGWLAANAQPDGYWGETGLRVIALLAGGIVSFALTLIFLAITVYVSSIYVLSLQIAEEISWWDAFRSLLSLIINTQYDWIVISEGKIARVKEKGVMKELGGPGKIIVDPGNAVVLQRGGKITQVRGAGVWMTKRNENIREIFHLTNQFTVTTVEKVLTTDQIPLDVEMGIGYRIVRETDPNTEGLIDSRDDTNGFPVKKETLLKAIFNNTSGGKWSGFAGGAPTVQLRDHFMTYTLDELFELAPENENMPRPNRRRINQIEQRIMESLNSFASNLGVTISGVDIRSIKLPDKMMETMMLELKSNAEARAIQRITEVRNRAQRQLIEEILATIANYKGQPLDEVDIQLARELVESNKRTMSDDVLGHKYVEMLEKLAESDGPKVFTPFPFDFSEMYSKRGT